MNVKGYAEERFVVKGVSRRDFTSISKATENINNTSNIKLWAQSLYHIIKCLSLHETRI
jgi:hypothetical protein